MLKKQAKLLTVFLIVSVNLIMAQEKKGIPEEERSFLYRKEISGNIHIHSNGWGLGFRYGRHLTGDIKRTYDADITGMKHPKEYKINSDYDNSQSYTYGKKNGFLVVRTGYGFQSVIFGKADRTGVEIRYNYFAGASWGLTKPIYLYIMYPNLEEKTEKFDPTLHHSGNITGQASFAEGFSEIKLHPGLYGKFSFSFEFGAKDQVVKALETGMAIDVYLKKIPIMANDQNKQLFLTFYANFTFGKKW